jgi:predicted MPP superfamily phosphohydrolase
MSFSNIIIIILALTGLVSWLNYRQLSGLSSFYRGRMGKYSYLLVTAAAILIMYYSRLRRPSLMEPDHEFYYLLVYGALAWLCGQFVLGISLPFVYAADKLMSRTGETTPVPEAGSPGAVMTRRTFLHGVAAVMPLAAVGIGAQGIYQAQMAMTIRQHALKLPGLPDNLQGFTIGQVSDTHLGPYFSLERLDTVIELLRRQKPDLVVITGDFADDLNLLAPAIDRLNKLQPLIPRGIYFCLGNHEYIRNVNYFRAEFAKNRITLLSNSNRLIVPGPRPLYLLGVDYPGSDTSRSALDISVSRRRQYFGAANMNIPAQAFKVLIAHHPDFLFDGFADRIPLTLAGHTHGGQVVIGGKSPFDRHVYMRGLYQENGVYGYVSSGAGHWFPFRLGCPPEISVFTLQA